MKNIQHIGQTQLAALHFAKSDVLHDQLQRYMRICDLQRAVQLGCLEHEPVNLIFTTDQGQRLQVESLVWAVSDDFVLLQGGRFLPVRSISTIEA
ncbi:hypothetical protein [Cesiribacter andamanensis]|uniref:Uncharacterized protein n=1 Tax=Cesiribacter andamanensis AMV16 TaxID=1279009 RepID=M7NLC7_9BACT|nr:hypothetical protein [Cesiribacter andamanensis]EMR02595.1 hypothetical protein ADICEAN_02251 [Cesiribacter andamanensis AMV16]